MLKFSKIKIISVIALTLFAVPQISMAAPDITSVSGSFNNSQTLTLVGSGFGVKSPAAPVKWDNFETGVAGQDVGNGWGLTGDVSPKYSAAQLRPNSNKSVACQMTTPSGWNSSITWPLSPTDTQSYYVTTWRYEDRNAILANTKPERFYGNGAYNKGQPNEISGVPQAMYSYQTGQVYLGVYVYGTDPVLMQLKYPDNVPPAYTWYRTEQWLYSGHQGVADGVYWYGVLGPGFVKHWNPPTNSPFLIDANRFIRIDIGHYATPHILTAYVDDVYIDITQARVELCDANLWANRTHCEIQPPTSWSDTSIGITFNTGSFVAGNTAYLYAVDSTGAVNSSGYPITLGPGQLPDTTPPAAPTGVTVS